MDISLPEMQEILFEIKALKEMLQKPTLTQEWYNEKEVWQLKGGCSFATFQSRRYYQPKGGIPDGKVGGRKVWHRDTLIEWLPLSDEQLPEYHEKYKTGARR